MALSLRAVGVLVVACAVGVAACDDDEATPSDDVAPSNFAMDFDSPPYTEGIEVGRTYNYSLPTHCGITQTRIDGSNWKASPPLSDGNGNPPEVWMGGPTVGRLTIVSEDKAIFTMGSLSATFVRADLEPMVCL